MTLTLLDTDEIIAAISRRQFSTAELVRLHHAVALKGRNTTSVLGQYGEELVAAAFGGTVESFDNKSYDVVTREGERLQVKTYSRGRGKRPGGIRAFEHDVITVCVDGASAGVVQAKHYEARELYDFFRQLHPIKYADMAWGGLPSDRFERSWTIARGVPFTDVTDLIKAAKQIVDALDD